MLCSWSLNAPFQYVHLQRELCLSPAPKVFISSTLSVFVYYLEVGLETPLKNTNREKICSKTSFQVGMDARKVQKQSRNEIMQVDYWSWYWSISTWNQVRKNFFLVLVHFYLKWSSAEIFLWYIWIIWRIETSYWHPMQCMSIYILLHFAGPSLDSVFKTHDQYQSYIGIPTKSHASGVSVMPRAWVLRLSVQSHALALLLNNNEQRLQHESLGGDWRTRLCLACRTVVSFMPYM